MTDKSGYPTQQRWAYPPKSEPYPPQPRYGQPQYGQPQYSQANTSHTAVIVSQPKGPGNVIVQPRPPDYMVASIFACLCCFCPTGLCAIYFASQANTLASRGDMEGARRMSNNARNLMISSVVIGIIWIIVVIVLRFVVFSSNYSRY